MSGAATGYIALAAATALTGWMGSKAAKKNQRASNAMLQKQLDFQKEQQAKLDKQKDIYRQFKFENPYAGVENAYEGLQTDFENVYEDLKVSTGAADFQMEQGAQQRANIMQEMRGAAGGSGIAGLAQALASQGQLQARQVSVDLAKQEAINQQLTAKGAMSVQQFEAAREELIAKGASAADMATRGGDAMVQEAEMSRQSTLLGIQYGSLAGANAGVQSAYSNQMAANSAAMQMQMQNMQSFTNMASKMSWDQMNLGGPQGTTDPVYNTYEEFLNRP